MKNRAASPLKIGTILAPTDYSATSIKAIAYAVSLAMRCESKITLLHVLTPLPYPADMAYMPLGQGFPMEPSRTELELFAKRTVPEALLGGIAVRVGVPHETITEFARTEKADLIVIGTHGHSDFAHVFLGSTAERVVRHAPCPVLVLRR
jgi:nucleotide-binding universal stress UspA family protein